MYLHDPEYHLTFAEAMAPGGPVEALIALRDRGVLGHLGIAAGPVRLMREFIATGLFEVVLSHNRFTLVDRSAEPLMDDAGQRGVAFVNGAPYGGRHAGQGPRRPAQVRLPAARRRVSGRSAPCSAPARPPGCRWRRRRSSSRCATPRVTSTVVGVSDPARISRTAALAALDIPDSLWPELAALAPAADSWLG